MTVQSAAFSFEHWMTARWAEHLRRQLATAVPPLADALKTRLQTATVVHPDEILLGRVQFGSRVTVFGIEEEEEQSFQIVSADESESGPGLLDARAPLAQALLGAREGDVVTVKMSNGANCQYEVTHILLP